MNFIRERWIAECNDETKDVQMIRKERILNYKPKVKEQSDE